MFVGQREQARGSSLVQQFCSFSSANNRKQFNLDIACDCCATSDISVGEPFAYLLKHTTAVQSCLTSSTIIITSRC